MTVPSRKKIFWPRVRVLCRPVLFFVLYYLYAWRVIETALYYPGGAGRSIIPLFSHYPHFYREFVDRPGGPVEYAAAYIAQFYGLSAMGALLITALGLLAFLSARWLISAAGAISRPALAFLPPMLLLLAYNQHAYVQDITISLLTAEHLALLLAGLAVVIYARFGPVQEGLRAAFFLVLAVMLYYLAGGALLPAALCGGLWEFLRRRWLLGLLNLLWVPLIVYGVGSTLCLANITDAYLRLLPIHLYSAITPVSMALLACWPLLMLLPPILSRFRLSVGGKSARFAGFFAPEPVRTLALIGITAALLWLTSAGKAVLQMDYFARRGMWTEVLRAAGGIAYRRYDPFFNAEVNRALFHLGRLPEEMFSYPKQTISPLRIYKEDEPRNSMLMTLSDVYCELGELNQAEHWAHELLALLGNHPMLLERLAKINLVKGQSEAARVFLNALDQEVLYRDGAERYRQRLRTDPVMAADPEIEYLRSVRSAADQVGQVPEELSYMLLLQRNPRNRMAYEYLMAYYLLNRRLDKLVMALECLDDLGYRQIPRHWEEALVIYLDTQREKAVQVDLRGRRISPVTIQRWRDFLALYNRFRGGEEVLLGELERKYGDSYFFYYSSNKSGMQRVR